MYRFKLYHPEAGEYELKHAPLGWDTMELTMTRDRKLHGVTMDYTADLTFVKDGFDYVHSVYEAFGIEASILIYVYEANRLNFHYDLVYTGIIALEKWEVQDFPRQGKANIDLAGFVHKFLNAEDTKVNLHANMGVRGNPMGPLPTLPVNMHSQAIAQGFSGLKTVDSNSIWFMTSAETRKAKFTFGFNEVEVNELEVFNAGDGWLDQTADNPLLESKVKATLNLDFKLVGSIYIDDKIGTWDAMTAQVLFRKNNDAPIILHNYVNNDTDGSDRHNYNIARKMSVNVEPGDKIYLYGVVEVTDIRVSLTGNYSFAAEHMFFRGSYLKISGSTTTATSDARGVLVHEAFARVVESITGYKDSFHSPFFGRTDSFPSNYPQDGAGSRMMLLNGFALRGFPQDFDPTITDADKLKRYLHMSFKDIFEAMDAIWCLGVGIERINGLEKVVVEKRQYFYRAHETAVHLGKVSGLKKSVREEDYYKEATFGYRNWKIEDTNGLNEFNALQTWATPVTKTKNNYDGICEFIAAGYRIEQVRRERYVDADTKDNQDDDNVFVVTLVRSNGGWQTATSEGVISSTGLGGTSDVYNLRISPRNMLNNHAPVLDASLYKIGNQLLFTKGEGNYKMSYTTDEGTIQNGVSIPRSELTGGYFIPEEYQFEATVNQFQAKAIRENPYALIKFTDSAGTELKGYLLEMKYQAREKKGRFTLLRATE